MSQFDLNQLSKKNQEFIRIAKHQLLRPSLRLRS